MVKKRLKKQRSLRPDVITMDIEISPVMDGITAVREIMAASPTPILMFSSLTHDGARATLDALDAGAPGFLYLSWGIARNRDDAVALLQQQCDSNCARSVHFMRRVPVAPRAAAATTTSTPSSLRQNNFSGNACCEACCCIDCKIWGVR